MFYLKARLCLSIVEFRNALFSVCFIVCAVKHINTLCSIAMLQLGGNCCCFIIIFAVFSAAMLKCEQALKFTAHK